METSRFTSSGFAFLQSKLLLDETSTKEQEPTMLSKPARVLLMNMLKQENVDLTNHPNQLSMSMKAARASAFSQKQSNKKIIVPGMTDETKLSLAYNHEISLLGSLLQVVDQNHQKYHETSKSVTGGSSGFSSSTTIVSGSVSTKVMFQQCAYTVIPQKTPALLSAREMVCAALHFLCQESPIKSSSSSSTHSTAISASLFSIRLPLIQSTSMSSDIERRSYDKAYDWNFTTILPQVLLLEHEFYNNILIPSSNMSENSKNQNPLMWLPRDFFVPDVKDDQMLRRIYIQGSLPPTTNDGKKEQKKNTEKSKSKTPAKNVTITTKSPPSSSAARKSIQIKRKLPSTTPKSKTKSKEDAETDATQRSGTAIKKIKITMSSMKKSSKTPKDGAVPMPPANLDHLLATETNPMFDDEEEDDDDTLQFD